MTAQAGTRRSSRRTASIRSAAPCRQRPHASSFASGGPARLAGRGRYAQPQMEPSREALLDALARVIDPELRKPVTELDMVRALDVDGGDVHGHDRAHGRRLPAAQLVPGAGRARGRRRSRASTSVRLEFDVMTPDERAALTHEAARRPARADERSIQLDPRTRVIAVALGQGRRRQVVADREPRGRAVAARAPGRDPRRRHLRPLDPAHARHPPEAGARRQADRPAGRARPEADVDRLLPRRQRSR